MKFQGQFITVTTTLDEDDNLSVAAIYGVSDARAEEMRTQLADHCHSLVAEDGSFDLKQAIETIPMDATSPGELVLAGVFIGQLSSGLEYEREQRNNPVSRLAALFSRAMCEPSPTR